MTEYIEFEDLQKVYDDETIGDIVAHWQEDIFVNPLTCYEHKNILLLYEKGVLYCPEQDCFYHTHRIPTEVVNHWNEIGE